MTEILVVDNRDSFVHTLVGYLHELGAATTMVEADEVVDAASLVDSAHALLISPGPGTPAAAGRSIEIVREAARRRIPVLGVCLGHQAIAAAFGASVGHAPDLMHGMTSDIRHHATGLYEGIPSPVTVGRYHSLAVDPATVPAELIVTARTDEGVIMSVSHRDLPIVGIQFHPESVLTEHGYRMLANWLTTVDGAAAADAVSRSAALHPLVRTPSRPSAEWSNAPEPRPAGSTAR